MADEREGEAEAAAALAVIRRWLDAVKAMPGADARVAAVRDLISDLQELYDAATGIRTDAMFQIYDQEKLSLAPLADRVGISKARAHQQIRKRGREEGKRDAGADESPG